MRNRFVKQLSKSARAVILVLALTGMNSRIAGGADWPQWRGPTQDGISRETGLLKQWPEEGPTLLWIASGCGDGFSSVVASDGMIYTAGVISGRTDVVAFDLDGKLVWRSPNQGLRTTPLKTRWEEQNGGSRATPTVEGGFVFHLNEVGRLAAYHAKSGKEEWAIDIKEKFDAEWPLWGYSESVLIDGDHVICYRVAERLPWLPWTKKTGRVVWTTRQIDAPAYCSPLLVVDQGVRQIVTMTATAVVGVNADTGEFLWRYSHINNMNENINTPIYNNGFVYVSSGLKRGSDLLKLKLGGTSIAVERVWTNQTLDSSHGGVILLDGYLYGSGDCNPFWFCLDIKNGREMYRAKGVDRGSITYADGMFYCLGENGVMALVKSNPREYEIVSSFRLPQSGEGPYWAHPIVCGKRLYVRHTDNLYVYNIAVE